MPPGDSPDLTPMLCCAVQGVLTTLAIGVHNVPEGLAKATVLVSQGVSARNALLWSVLTCLPQPLVAIPSFLFVEAFRVSREREHASVGCADECAYGSAVGPGNPACAPAW